MGGQEGDFGRRKGEPGKAVRACKRGKELNVNENGWLTWLIS